MSKNLDVVVVHGEDEHDGRVAGELWLQWLEWCVEPQAAHGPIFNFLVVIDKIV